MKFLIVIFIVFLGSITYGQDLPGVVEEQQMENLSEAEEGETEDDSFLQQLQYLRKNPLNLNSATETDLLVFRQLTSLQIQNLLQYRQKLGNLISFYELQAIPGWDIETIAALRPFVFVGIPLNLTEDLWKRLNGGDHSLLFRVAQVLEKSRGFTKDTSGVSPYAGSPQRLFFRYKYVYKNQLQFGFLGEKDAGEQFFKGTQKKGFDFYSFHVFARNIGAIRRIAIGDFTVNMAQGLLSMQSLAFRKSVDVLNIKRQAEIFRPYNSAGEFNFHRGVAVSFGLKNFEASVFYSRKKVNANASIDSLESEDFFSSLVMSGLHRTGSEAADKRSINQQSFGGRLQYSKNQLKLGVNGVHYQLGKPFIRTEVPYNAFAFTGKRLTGYSVDYGYTFRNIHLFGEVASDHHGHMAQVHGLLASLHAKADFSLLYRRIAKDYHSLYAVAFTESTLPINENGLFTGLTIRPWGYLRVDMYADIYSFPWLRFRVNRPSKGSDYLVQLTWKPNKQVEVYTRFKAERKAINYSNTNAIFYETEDIPRQNWRTQISYKISQAVTVRARAEAVWYDYKGKQAETGFLMFADVFYKPWMKPYALNARFQYFETDGFNSRLYAYENDVLYSFSIPPASGKGTRAYININYDIGKKWTLWFRIARSMYPEEERVGSGNDQINQNHRTDYRIQIRYQW